MASKTLIGSCHCQAQKPLVIFYHLTTKVQISYPAFKNLKDVTPMSFVHLFISIHHMHTSTHAHMHMHIPLCPNRSSYRLAYINCRTQWISTVMCSYMCNINTYIIPIPHTDIIFFLSSLSPSWVSFLF